MAKLFETFLTQNNSQQLDKSYLFWLITYFLRVSPKVEMKTEQINKIFTSDLLCFLVYENAKDTEEFKMNSSSPPARQQLNLGVTAIREYLQALQTYSRLGSKVEQTGVTQLLDYLPAIRDLRQLFLMHLRQFDPNIQSRKHLRDVITANHVLLLTLERAAQQSSYSMQFDLRQHLTQFSTRKIISCYGSALQDFKTNGPFVNDCILTLLHHVGADLGRADLLCDSAVLRPFCKIWEEKFDVSLYDIDYFPSLPTLTAFY